MIIINIYDSPMEIGYYIRSKCEGGGRSIE